MSEMMEELQSMGYSQTLCERALEVSGYDLEQAVGYLLLEKSQRNFDENEYESNAAAAATTTSTTSIDEDVSIKHLTNSPTDSAGPDKVTVGNILPQNRIHDDDGPLTDTMSSKEGQLLKMGYSIEESRQALHVAHGDMAQAINFLCMGESKLNFMINDQPPTQPSAIMTPVNDHKYVNDDAALAAAILDEDIRYHYDAQCKAVAAMEQQKQQQQSRSNEQLSVAPHGPSQFLKTPPNCLSSSLTAVAVVTSVSQQRVGSALLLAQSTAQVIGEKDRTRLSNVNNGIHSSSSRPKPKIVAAQTFLTIRDALPFCTCVCASKFLSGGIVSTSFIHGIMESGVELYRKATTKGTTGVAHDLSSFNIDTVLKKYGRSSQHLRISAVIDGDLDPRHGLFMEHDLSHGSSIRQYLKECRNGQGTGWQVVLIDLNGTNDDDQSMTSDSFCICLPPKGTTSKFWFFDFIQRDNVQTSGAYALVHSTLQYLEESLVSVFKTIVKQQQKEFLSFTFYRVKKIK